MLDRQYGDGDTAAAVAPPVTLFREEGNNSCNDLGVAYSSQTNAETKMVVEKPQKRSLARLYQFCNQAENAGERTPHGPTQPCVSNPVLPYRLQLSVQQSCMQVETTSGNDFAMKEAVILMS
jgi:hypothetical protein